MTEWRPIPGFEGAYEVNDEGHVRSLDRVLVDVNGKRRRWKGRELAQTPSHGRPVVGLGRARLEQPGVLVMLAFVGPRPEGLNVCHLNDDPWDNRLENLYYGTHSQNMQDQVRNGRNYEANKTHCDKGHPFDEDNTGWWSGGVGKSKRRRCKTCDREKTSRSAPRVRVRNREKQRAYEAAYRARKRAEC